MNLKQKRFADEYLIDLNATQAAIRAGYSKKTADVIAHQLLRKTSVSEYVKSRTQTLADKLGIDAEYILGSAKNIADMTRPKSAEANSAVSLKAIETLGKYLKIFGDDEKNKQATTINIQLVNY